MRSWQVATSLLAVWTLAMAAWFALYRAGAASCGPEIYRECQIGVKVTGGLGRSGIALLWSLVVVAVGMTWLTRPAAGVARSKPARRPLGPSLQRACGLAVAIVPVAVVMGLAASTEDDDTRAPRSGPAPAPAPASAPAVDLEVVSAILHPASTPTGRRRGAARLSVHVRVTNPRGNRPLPLGKPVLLSGGEVLEYDPAQIVAARSLLEPLAAGATADGTLRFEPRGRFTERLVAERRAALRFAGRTVPVSIKIGRPVK